MNVEDLGVIAGGTAVLTFEWWWNILYMTPEGLKFIGLVATVIYLVIRAVNETLKLLKGRGHDS